MKCAWQAYINLLPLWLRQDVDRLGKDTLQELRLRLGQPPELVLKEKHLWLKQLVSTQDLEFVINMASKYSPWTSASIRKGFVTAEGGHRIGICGDVVMNDTDVKSISTVTSISVRVARDFYGIGQQAQNIKGSVLIIGSPGRGKTTLLRDIIRIYSNMDKGIIAVIDERRELFPMTGNSFCFDIGKRTDVLSGCSKQVGIEMLLRTMTPDVIAVDEITAADDCAALLHAGWCGVRLFATAHAENRYDLISRPLYKPLLQCGLFQNLIVMQKDKSWTLERMNG